MKKLNIISKVVVMLLVVLQMNNASAKTLNESNIELLAEKIVQSKSGINYMAVQSVNALSLISSIASMTENERLMVEQRFESFGKLNNEEFTPTLKEEFAKLRGMADYNSYKNLLSIRTTSLQMLVSDFPEIKTISSSDRGLLFEKIAEKFDYAILSSNELYIKESYATCVKRALESFGVCMVGTGSALVLRKFMTCVLFAEGVESVVSEGLLDIPLFKVDVKVCAAVMNISVGLLGTCTTELSVKAQLCK
jgi:hypothetical protein